MAVLALEDRHHLADPLAREEAVGSLRVGPVLAGQRQRRAHRALESMQQPSQSITQALVAERTAGQFSVDPGCLVGVVGHTRTAGARLSVRARHRSFTPRDLAASYGIIPRIASSRARAGPKCG